MDKLEMQINKEKEAPNEIKDLRTRSAHECKIECDFAEKRHDIYLQALDEVI